MIPEVGRLKRIRLPRVFDEVLPNGLRTVIVRRPGAPLVEMRLRIPMPATTAGEEARRDLLTRTLKSGTSRRSEVDIAARLQEIGGSLGVGTDEDGLYLEGSALSGRMGDLLDLVVEILTDATFPDSSVWTERARLAQEVVLARAQPEVVAGEELRKRFFGRHPYGLGLPSPSGLRRVTSGRLQTLYDDLVRPGGAVMVLVGDLRPAAEAERVADAMRRWRRKRRPLPVPKPSAPRPRPMLVVHRPGSRQTNIRLGGLAPGSGAKVFPAFELANLIFGGYFSSRLVVNLREDKGFTYNPASRIHHAVAASTITISADVRSEVTGAALVETMYELGRIVSTPPEATELEEARRYRIGTLAIGTHTQAGFADTLGALLSRGLDVTYLRSHQDRLEEVSVDDVLTAAREFLAPSCLIAVLVGDADVIVPQIAPFGRFQVRA
ncbi:peptidase M16 inactive domain protein [bacterium BMS3Bbin01]|nr:peptidase M16 inactive domain protein [bacterium BMS3Bbin01]